MRITPKSGCVATPLAKGGHGLGVAASHPGPPRGWLLIRQPPFIFIFILFSFFVNKKIVKFLIFKYL
jgi:hypothetical protein